MATELDTEKPCGPKNQEQSKVNKSSEEIGLIPVTSQPRTQPEMNHDHIPVAPMRSLPLSHSPEVKENEWPCCFCFDPRKERIHRDVSRRRERSRSSRNPCQKYVDCCETDVSCKSCDCDSE